MVVIVVDGQKHSELFQVSQSYLFDIKIVLILIHRGILIT